MEDIITYIIVFGLIIGGVSIWQFRNAKARPYLLSRQNFPGFNLSLSIEKFDGKTKEFIIKTIFDSQLEPKNLWLEMINAKRETNAIQLSNTLTVVNANNSNGNKTLKTYTLPFNDLTKLLSNSQFNYNTFRVVVGVDSGRKFKSHELALNKRWTIYRPDSGKYN